jgi:KUP system potassium uptake protein
MKLDEQHHHSHPLTAMALLIAIGIVFGDIGTSPLYVMKTIVGAGRGISDTDYFIGAVSCIIWTLTLQTTFKYVIIALRADNKGEGGILALYSLIKRSPRKWLYAAAAIGAATLIADGVITPAITVTSAVEGLEDIDANIQVVPIVLIIITLVFGVQRFGTSAIGKFFGPFMFLWFSVLGIVGAYAMREYPMIIKAFNPYYAWHLLSAYPGWFLILGAIFLCTTGAEALYSDLGHCGRRNITISWIFVKLTLILNYLGQGAWLVRNHATMEANVNPFYAIMPQWMLIPGILLATGAAIIASQALISGSFSIFSEAMNLNLWPRIKIKYPTQLKGQLYIPSVNTFLYVGCIVTVLIFRNSAHMEAAYGLAITMTMIVTTILLAFYLKLHKTKGYIIAAFVTCFGIIEGAFFIANAFKFAHGGWYTILIAGVVCSVMIIWYNGTRIRSKYIEMNNLSQWLDVITDIKKDNTVPMDASNLVFISKSLDKGKVESKLMYSIINKGPKRADHYFLIRIDFTGHPDTLEYEVETLVDDTFFDITLHLGYRVQPRISLFLRHIVEDLVAEGRMDLTSTHPSLKSRHIPGNFKFIIIRRVFSPTSVCTAAERFVMTRYEKLRHLSSSYQTTLGLDTTNLTIERVPLIIMKHSSRRIQRVVHD